MIIDYELSNGLYIKGETIDEAFKKMDELFYDVLQENERTVEIIELIIDEYKDSLRMKSITLPGE